MKKSRISTIIRFAPIVIAFLIGASGKTETVLLKDEIRRAQLEIDNLIEIEQNPQGFKTLNTWTRYGKALRYLEATYPQEVEIKKTFATHLWTGFSKLEAPAKLSLSVSLITDILRFVEKNIDTWLTLDLLCPKPFPFKVDGGTRFIKFRPGDEEDLFIDFGEGTLGGGFTTIHKNVRHYPSFDRYIWSRPKEINKEIVSRFKNGLKFLRIIQSFDETEREGLPFPRYIGMHEFIHAPLDSDLYAFWQKRQSKFPFNEVATDENLYFLFKDILKSVTILHKYGIAHGDLKPENILISQYKDQNGTPRMRPILWDFDLATVPFSFLKTGHSIRGGSHTYAPLEVFENNWCGTSLEEKALNGLKVDVFAVAVMIHSILNKGISWSHCSTLIRKDEATSKVTTDSSNRISSSDSISSGDSFSYSDSIDFNDTQESVDAYYNCFKKEVDSFFLNYADARYSRFIELLLAALRTHSCDRIDSEEFLEYWGNMKTPKSTERIKKAQLLENFEHLGIRDLDTKTAKKFLLSKNLGDYILFPTKGTREGYKLGLAYVTEGRPGNNIVMQRVLPVSLKNSSEAQIELHFLESIHTLVKNLGLRH